jgi:ubiquitin-activating enzyme E1
MQSLVQVARDQFDIYFNYNLRDFLALFPPDAKTTSGEPFWSGPKRCPTPIEFDANNDDHLLFAHSCANLIAFNLGIPQVTDKEQMRKYAANTQAKPYTQKKIVVETPEEAKAREARGEPAPTAGPVASENDHEEVNKLSEELKTVRDKI